MGWAVGELYAERHFLPALKAEVEVLITNLIRTFRARVETRDWMGETRAEA